MVAGPESANAPVFSERLELTSGRPLLAVEGREAHALATAHLDLAESEVATRPVFGDKEAEVALDIHDIDPSDRRLVTCSLLPFTDALRRRRRALRLFTGLRKETPQAADCRA